MRRSIALLIASLFLISGAPTVSAAQKACTDSQLTKIYKLAIDFNDNRSFILKFSLNVDRSVAGILKAQGARDVNAERLWWINFNTATSEAKRLTIEENQILKSLKGAFNCSGHGVELDAKYGYIGVKKNLKTKAWPASVRLTPAPGSNVPAAPIVPTALSAKEAKDCSRGYKNRIYINAESFIKNYFRVYKLENVSDCVVFFNLTFDVYCPDRNTNLLTNPDFPYPVRFAGGYKLEPRQIWELEEDGFASKVGEKCYAVTNRWPNFVQLQSALPTIDIASVQAPEVILSQSQVQAGRKTCAVAGSCPIGSKGPGGGIVFYDAGSQQSWGRYLEVAPIDWSGSSTDPKEKWCVAGVDYGNFQKNPGTGTSSIESFLGSEIGTGTKNTDLMIAKCTQGAANLARKYSGGGKSDWSLPSREEFVVLWKYQLTDKYLVEGNPGTFWTSTEWGYHYAISHGLGISISDLRSSDKGDARPVRPVRAF